MHFPEMEQIILFESRARGTTDRIIIEVPTKREFSPSGKIFGWRNGRHRIPFNTSRLTLTGPGHSLSAWPARQPIGFVTIHPVVQDISSEHDGDDDPFLTGSTHAATLPRRCPLQPVLPFRPDLPPTRVDSKRPSAKGHRRSDASYPESRPRRDPPTRK